MPARFGEWNSVYQRFNRWSSKETDHTRAPAFPVLVDEYPEIVGGSRFAEHRHKIRYGDQMLLSSVHYVDTSFATTFSFPVLYGDVVTALRTPNHMVLTREAAQQFFGDENPIGKVLEVDQRGEHLARFTVGAVVEDPPLNSSLQFKVLIPWLNALAAFGTDRLSNWYSTNTMTFIRLAPGTHPDLFVKELASFK